MGPRRWFLLALSLASLVILSYAAIAVAFSIPVTEAMEDATAPAHDSPTAGQRVVVQPIVNPATIETFARDGRAGWLVVAERTSTLPVLAEDPSLVHAIAYVSVLHNGSYSQTHIELTSLTARGDNGTYSFSTIVNVTELGNGKTGFLVKLPESQNISFVDLQRVVGHVARFESSVWTFLLVAVGSVGFVAPLVALVITAKPAGKPGVPVGVVSGACPECRRPVRADADFCMSCGAWLAKKD